MNGGRGNRTWRWALGAVVMLAWIPGHAVTQEEQDLILEEAARKGVPGSLALAVAKAGSDLEGSDGQVMPLPQDVADDLYQASPSLLANAERLNVQLGMDFLSRQLKSHDGDWEEALGAYYDGDEEVTTGEKAFIKDVLRWQKKYARQGIGTAQKVETGSDSDNHVLNGWTEEDLTDLDVDTSGSARRGSATHRQETQQEAQRETQREPQRETRRDSATASHDWEEDTGYDQGYETSRRWDELAGETWVMRDPPWVTTPEPRQYVPSRPPVRTVGDTPTLVPERERQMLRECLRRTHKPEEACRRDVQRVLRGLPPA